MGVMAYEKCIYHYTRKVSGAWDELFGEIFVLAERIVEGRIYRLENVA